MVVHLLLLVGHVDTDEIGVLDVTHLDLLLFESITRLGFAVVKCAINLFAPALDLLANAIVFTLLFAQLTILVVALLLQLGSIVSVQLAQLFGPCTKDLQGISKLGDESASELFVFGGARFEGAQLDTPCGHGSATRTCQGGPKSCDRSRTSRASLE